MDALTCIQSSLHKEINLEAIASKVYLSESRFAHLFKEQTGIPLPALCSLVPDAGSLKSRNAGAIIYTGCL